MVAATRLTMHDLQRQRRVDVDLRESEDLTVQHSVGQAVDHFRNRLQVGEGGRWTAFSRGVMLDSKKRLGDLSAADTDWVVMPEVSAG